MTLYSLIITLQWKHLLETHYCSVKSFTSVEFASASTPSTSLRLLYCSSQKATVPIPPAPPFTLATAILPKCPHLQRAWPRMLGLRSSAVLSDCTRENSRSSSVSPLCKEHSTKFLFPDLSILFYSYSARHRTDWDMKHQVRGLPQTGFQVEKVKVNLICETFGRGE